MATTELQDFNFKFMHTIVSVLKTKFSSEIMVIILVCIVNFLQSMHKLQLNKMELKVAIE